VKKCKIATAHSQSMLYGGVLHNIKRKKYKTALQTCHSQKSPSSEWS